MTANITLQEEARTLIREADFVRAWPTEVKIILSQAIQTPGDLPVYAVKQVKWAIKEARNVERKCERDIAQGIAALAPKERRQLLGA